MDDERSEFVSVDSGVPQDTVLGPLLFLLHIKNLPQPVRSSVCLFADDCLLYKIISSIDDTLVLQQDLDSLKVWGSRWGMRFNISKCDIMRLAWSHQPIKFYTPWGEIIEEVNQAKYLGVTLTSELNWSVHIDITTHKANSTLRFLRRSLRYCTRSLKELLYMSLVCSKLEYCTNIWDLHLAKDTDTLEPSALQVLQCYIDAPGPRLARPCKQAEGNPTGLVLQNSAPSSSHPHGWYTY